MTAVRATGTGTSRDAGRHVPRRAGRRRHRALPGPAPSGGARRAPRSGGRAAPQLRLPAAAAGSRASACSSSGAQHRLSDRRGARRSRARGPPGDRHQAAGDAPSACSARDVFAFLDRVERSTRPADTPDGASHEGLRDARPLRAAQGSRQGVRLPRPRVGAAGASVSFGDGARLEPDTVVWATGFRPGPLVRRGPGLRQRRAAGPPPRRDRAAPGLLLPGAAVAARPRLAGAARWSGMTPSSWPPDRRPGRVMAAPRRVAAAAGASHEAAREDAPDGGHGRRRPDRARHGRADRLADGGRGLAARRPGQARDPLGRSPAAVAPGPDHAREPHRDGAAARAGPARARWRSP